MKMKSILFFVVFALCVPAAKAQVNVQDSLALVDLYNSTDGPNWRNHKNWLTSSRVANWKGITVTNNRVRSIRLPQNKLNGSLPSSLGNLAKLENLYLPTNHLSGTIPSSLGNIVNLQYLDLSDNQLSGRIPSSLGNLVNLYYLRLQLNQLSGEIPSFIANFLNLHELALSYNQFSGSIPSFLGNLPVLEFLGLANNQLTDTIPSSLGNLNYLGSLALQHNQLSGSIPSSLGRLSNLYYGLSLSYNQLTGSIPSSLGNLSSVETMDLSYNKLSGSIPSSLGNLYFTEYLLLNNNRLTDSIPSSLGSLGYVEYLGLSNNRLSGTIPSSLGKLVNRVLGLSHNYFTFDGMELLAQTVPSALYSKQHRIPIHQHGNTLSVSAGGTLSNNTYKWYRFRHAGDTIIIKGDSVFHPTQNGKYLVRVKNSIATELTLFSDSIVYIAPAVIASTENSLLQNGKPNLFRIYPNPAKDILHVETNGAAMFSLIDQSGKIIVATNINGKGSINVSGITPGLYYLKNNSKGNVQKVVIVR